MEYSETESHFLDCPKCGHHFLHRLKVNFNTETHPEDRQSVRDGSAFQVRCPQCGAAWRVDYSFFYDQPQDQLALYCLLDLKEAASLADAIRRNLLPPEAAPTPVPSWQKYTWRVVRSLADFREKLTIFDAGLDDRYVELFKVFALNQLHVQQPDFQADEIRFAATRNNLPAPAGLTASPSWTTTGGKWPRRLSMRAPGPFSIKWRPTSAKTWRPFSITSPSSTCNGHKTTLPLSRQKTEPVSADSNKAAGTV